jgi:Protein of unknown function (DUF2510)
MSTPKQITPPGWYPDPEGGPALRWFNGPDWTYEYQAPTQQFAPPPAERRFTIYYGFALVAALSLIGTLFFAIPMFAAAVTLIAEPRLR